ncbi:MAG TPA: hypothetical protein VN951_02550 [Pyrinomonadaceae bacterium]|nr:hypothetical protein [Pyrinomonadaceae bacterium]
MRFRLSFACCCLLFFAGNTFAKTPSPCTVLKSRSDNWVAGRVNSLVTTARAAYESDDALPAYHRVLDGINRTLQRCKLSVDAGFIDRHREFVEYVTTISLDRKPDHELGFNVPDKQYFEETRSFVEIPDYLLQPAFLKLVSRWETLDKAKAFLRQLNSTRSASDQLVFFSYISRHLGTPDNDDSYRRLLIVVPGNAALSIPDKWVQFGISDPGQRVLTRNLSVVSAMTNANGTFDAYFKDYFRTYARNGSISIKGRWELGEGDDNCAQCHKSGILPIFPAAGSVSAAEREAVEIVNGRFRSYGSPRFGNYLDQTKLGPGLSTTAGEERNHRFGKDFAGTNVSRAMTCQSCHNPQRLGSLNWPMDPLILNSFVEGGQMPFGFTLKDVERRRLYTNLIEEYFATDNANPGILKSWLLGQRR